MPKTPTGHKRPADVVSNAVQVMKIATGEADESPSAKNSAAVELGRMGGAARAKKLSSQERRRIARKAATKRWAGGRQGRGRAK